MHLCPRPINPHPRRIRRFLGVTPPPSQFTKTHHLNQLLMLPSDTRSRLKTAMAITKRGAIPSCLWLCRPHLSPPGGLHQCFDSSSSLQPYWYLPPARLKRRPHQRQPQPISSRQTFRHLPRQPTPRATAFCAMPTIVPMAMPCSARNSRNSPPRWPMGKHLIPQSSTAGWSLMSGASGAATACAMPPMWLPSPRRSSRIRTSISCPSMSPPMPAAPALRNSMASMAPSRPILRRKATATRPCSIPTRASAKS